MINDFLNTKKLLTIGMMLYMLLGIFTPALAADQPTMGEMMDIAGSASGYSIEADQSPQVMIGRIIRAVLGFLGVMFMVLLIYGGFLWMTASGNEDQVTKAKKLIKNATIGVLIILTAEILTYFVLDKLLKAMKM